MKWNYDKILKITTYRSNIYDEKHNQIKKEIEYYDQDLYFF